MPDERLEALKSVYAKKREIKSKEKRFLGYFRIPRTRSQVENRKSRKEKLLQNNV